MNQRTQAERTLRITTELGEDVLLLVAMHGTERLGRLFAFELELLSETPDKVDVGKLLGSSVIIEMDVAEEGVRHFGGCISRFVLARVEGEAARYHCTVVPWLWFLTRTTDCRIFQNKKAPDIIKEIFKENGFSSVFDDRLSSAYEERVYCVQYRETDFNFVSRLMEEEGIYYYFEHGEEGHKLILCDAPSAHNDLPINPSVPFRPRSEAFTEQQRIYDWSPAWTVKPGKCVLKDFDFEKPDNDLTTPERLPAEAPSHPQSEHQIYDYPGGFVQAAHGETLAGIRIEEQHAEREAARAVCDVRDVCPGFTFTLEDFPQDEQNRKHLVTSAEYQLLSDAFGVQGAASEGQVFSCTFTAIPADRQFRPARVTPKPVVQGPQTAIVVGRSGEEIDTDEHGRVKVRFHWDRYSSSDENSSCWIRVAQSWAGRNWGALFLPRIGHEVVVEFLEGDPDRPLVTGSVYNGVQKTPYELDKFKTMSTVKSLSSKGGGGFNEIRFEDKKDEEQIFIHAERNQDIRVKKHCYETICGSRHLIVSGDQLEKVGGDKHLTVQGDRNEKVDGTISSEAGMDLQQKVGMNHAIDAGMEIHLKSGMNVVVEGGVGVTLKVGGNFINIGPAGIFIQGTMVMINSGGAAGSGAGCSPDAPKEPQAAAKADPGEVSEPPPAGEPPEPGQFSPAAVVLRQAADDGTPFCEKCEAARQAAAEGS